MDSGLTRAGRDHRRESGGDGVLDRELHQRELEERADAGEEREP